jgi:hypothetical protein
MLQQHKRDFVIQGQSATHHPNRPPCSTARHVRVGVGVRHGPTAIRQDKLVQEGIH